MNLQPLAMPTCPILSCKLESDFWTNIWFFSEKWPVQFPQSPVAEISGPIFKIPTIAEISAKDAEKKGMVHKGGRGKTKDEFYVLQGTSQTDTNNKGGDTPEGRKGMGIPWWFVGCFC